MYKWVEHTSEVELEIEAATEPAVFLEALDAFAELVADEQSADSEQRELEVRGDDRESLLVAWLDELAFLAETEGFVPQQVAEFDLSEGASRDRERAHGRRAPPRQGGDAAPAPVRA